MEIQVLIKNPNEDKLEIKTIEDELEVLQEIVEGYIEYVPIDKLSERNISMIVNEEGKINNLDINIAFEHDKKIIDYVCGNIIFVGLKETDDGLENDSLTDEQIKYVNSLLSQYRGLTKYNEIIPIMEI